MKISSHSHQKNISVFDSLYQAISRLLYRMHLLNLDVVGGAIASNLMVRHLLQVYARSIFSYYVLGSTIFIIYTTDRLWDVRRTMVSPLTPRHRFHYAHRTLLWFTVGFMVVLSGIITLIFLPGRIIGFGLGLALLVGIYLSLVHLLGAHAAKWFHKEPLVAVLYTAGVWGIVIVMSTHLSWIDWGLCLVFMLLAFHNLLLFSLFDLEEDLSKQERSLATHWGRKPTERVLNTLFVFVLFATIVLWMAAADFRQKEVVAVELVMSGILFIIGLFPASFKRHERYRWLGDGIFFLPLLTLW